MRTKSPSYSISGTAMSSGTGESRVREIAMLNIPQEDFVGEEERHLPRFPKGLPIVTFCAHGDAAQYSAEWLRKHGFDAAAIEAEWTAGANTMNIHLSQPSLNSTRSTVWRKGESSTSQFPAKAPW
jgi:hypothetical protein